MLPTRRVTNSTVVCLVGCMLLVLAQRTISEPVGGILTSLIYVVMIIVAGVIGGWRSGIAATLLGLFAAFVFFSPPYFMRAASNPIELFRLLSFGFLGVILSTTSGLLQLAWKRIEERQHRLEFEVNERQRAQVAEKARADELMTTLASIGDGVIRTDREGRITFLNPVAEKLIGWKTEPASGRMLSDVFHIVDAATHQPVENPAIRALRDNCIIGESKHTILISQDGRERPIDNSASPIRDASGIVIGSVLVFRDISGRKDAEHAQRESERRYRAIGESIDYGVWVCDSAGRNTYTSDSFLRLVGLTQEECSAFGWAAMLHPDDAESTIVAWQECVRLGSRWDREHRFQGMDGHWHYILARGIPIKNDLDEITSWVGINLDISRQKQIESELREADRRKNEFLATLAHELRNPLAPIKHAVQLMGFSKLDPEIDELRQMMARQVEQLVRLIDDLLDVSRISCGKIALRFETIDLSAVIAAAVEASATIIAENNQQLIVNVLAGDPVYVSGDPSRLTQVISNLLNNSAKYSDAGCRIELTTELEDKHAVIRVRDNGIGIAPELLQSIFQMFAQVDDTLERGSAGLGIGLALVKTLVELHEGTIVAESDGVGKGCVFTVRLPTADGPGALDIMSAVPSVVATSRSFKVLVVEDMRALRVIMARLLAKLGHEVEFAEDGMLALQRLDTYRPDIVFSDIAMPGMTGYELARQIRQRPDCSGIFLVALTGFGQSADRDKALEAGFDEHLVKPVDITQLQFLFDELSRSVVE